MQRGGWEIHESSLNAGIWNLGRASGDRCAGGPSDDRIHRLGGGGAEGVGLLPAGDFTSFSGARVSVFPGRGSSAG